jgi:hypothetical protein
MVIMRISDSDLQRLDFVDSFVSLLKHSDPYTLIQGVQIKSEPYFNMSNLFTKIYNMLYYTTNLYLQ